MEVKTETTTECSTLARATGELRGDSTLKQTANKKESPCSSLLAVDTMEAKAEEDRTGEQESVRCPAEGCLWQIPKRRCGQTTILIHALEAHHGDLKPLELAFNLGDSKCSTCGRVCWSFQHYQDHVQRHREVPRYPCLHLGCGARFKTGREMRLHTRRHTPLQAGCCFFGCAKLFVCLWALNLHEREHYGHASPAATAVKRQKLGRPLKVREKLEESDSHTSLTTTMAVKEHKKLGRPLKVSEKLEESDSHTSPITTTTAMKTKKLGRPLKVREKLEESDSHTSLTGATATTAVKSKKRGRPLKVRQKLEHSDSHTGLNTTMVVKEHKKRGRPLKVREKLEESDSHTGLTTTTTTVRTKKLGRPLKVREEEDSDSHTSHTTTMVVKEHKKRGRPLKVREKLEESDSHTSLTTTTIVKTKKLGRPLKVREEEDSDSQTSLTTTTIDVKTKKRGRPLKVREEEDSDSQTSLTTTTMAVKTKKRGRPLKSREKLKESDSHSSLSTAMAVKERKKRGRPLKVRKNLDETAVAKEQPGHKPKDARPPTGTVKATRGLKVRNKLGRERKTTRHSRDGDGPARPLVTVRRYRTRNKMRKTPVVKETFVVTEKDSSAMGDVSNGPRKRKRLSEESISTCSTTTPGTSRVANRVTKERTNASGITNRFRKVKVCTSRVKVCTSRVKVCTSGVARRFSRVKRGSSSVANTSTTEMGSSSVDNTSTTEMGSSSVANTVKKETMGSSSVANKFTKETMGTSNLPIRLTKEKLCIGRSKRSSLSNTVTTTTSRADVRTILKKMQLMISNHDAKRRGRRPDLLSASTSDKTPGRLNEVQQPPSKDRETSSSSDATTSSAEERQKETETNEQVVLKPLSNDQENSTPTHPTSSTRVEATQTLAVRSEVNETETVMVLTPVSKGKGASSFSDPPSTTTEETPEETETVERMVLKPSSKDQEISPSSHPTASSSEEAQMLTITSEANELSTGEVVLTPMMKDPDGTMSSDPPIIGAEERQMETETTEVVIITPLCSDQETSTSGDLHSTRDAQMETESVEIVLKPASKDQDASSSITAPSTSGEVTHQLTVSYDEKETEPVDQVVLEEEDAPTAPARSIVEVADEEEKTQVINEQLVAHVNVTAASPPSTTAKFTKKVTDPTKTKETVKKRVVKDTSKASRKPPKKGSLKASKRTVKVKLPGTNKQTLKVTKKCNSPPSAETQQCKTVAEASLVKKRAAKTPSKASRKPATKEPSKATDPSKAPKKRTKVKLPVADKQGVDSALSVEKQDHKRVAETSDSTVTGLVKKHAVKDPSKASRKPATKDPSKATGSLKAPKRPSKVKRPVADKPTAEVATKGNSPQSAEKQESKAVAEASGSRPSKAPGPSPKPRKKPTKAKLPVADEQNATVAKKPTRPPTSAENSESKPAVEASDSTVTSEGYRVINGHTVKEALTTTPLTGDAPSAAAEQNELRPQPELSSPSVAAATGRGRRSFRLPPTAYLDERFTTMPKRRKMMSWSSPPSSPIRESQRPPDAAAAPVQRRRCAKCFSTFNRPEELQAHMELKKCASNFGFDSDDESEM